MFARDAQLDGEPLIEGAAIEAFRAHAIECFPEECIGFLMADGSYRPAANISPHPLRAAHVDPSEITDLIVAGQLRALCHSHPGGPDCPSEQDMAAQIEMERPWIICSTNGGATTEPFAFGDQLVNPAPMLGRPFRSGVTDCYEAIRVWGVEKRGVLLPNIPRGWEWWSPGYKGARNLYLRNFADAGFYQIDRRDMREGDCWLAAVRSEQPNHAGVFLAGGLSFHHPTARAAYDPSSLSRRDPTARWAPMITHCLRRDDWC